MRTFPVENFDEVLEAGLNCSLSSIAEHSFHGITPPLKKGKV
jgi:hypothetical protein